MTSFENDDRSREIDLDEQAEFVYLVDHWASIGGIAVPGNYEEVLTLPVDARDVRRVLEPLANGVSRIVRIACWPVEGTATYNLRRELHLKSQPEELDSHEMRSVTCYGLRDHIDGALAEIEPTPYVTEETEYRWSEYDLWTIISARLADLRGLIEEHGSLEKARTLIVDCYVPYPRTFETSDLDAVKSALDD